MLNDFVPTLEQQMNVIKVPEGAYLIYNQLIFPLKHLVTYIGRKSDNDLVIQEPTISRKHAEIRYEGGEFILFDLDSVNGTRINNQEIEKSVLLPGTLIYLGDVALVFVLDNNKITESLLSSTQDLEKTKK